MKNNPIIIICGEPNSVFSEIMIKSFKNYKSNKPIVLIGSLKLIKSQFKKLNIRYSLNLISFRKNKFQNLKKNKINILNINYIFKKPFEKISYKSNTYISNCFKKAFEIIKKKQISGLINGPISKKYFLKNKYEGVTEYLAKKNNIKEKYSMLIYNKSLAVSPITTHLPINKISKNITKKKIIQKTLLIENFYKSILLKKPKIAMTGLNPHCENFFGLSEEKKIIIPAIKYLKKKKLDITGPFPADTIFLKQNLKKYDVIVGMYHDQVLAPIKSLFAFNAINITLGLPFLRISPDHGPNFSMVGKNKSNSQSLTQAIKFLNKKK